MSELTKTLTDTIIGRRDDNDASLGGSPDSISWRPVRMAVLCSREFWYAAQTIIAGGTTTMATTSA